ncbi:MAG: hypothetical protein ABI145_02825 [Steroidobacteraceae bacterium]
MRAESASKSRVGARVIASLLICAAPHAGAIDLKSFEAARASCQATLARNDFAGARTECEGPLREAPEHPSLQSRLAQSFVGLGRLSEAQAIFQNIIDEGFGGVVVGLPAFAKLAGRPGYDILKAQAAAQIAPIAPASQAFVIPERNFIAEGLAFDPGSGRFFAGSTYLRKIVAREPDGRLVDFVSSGDHGLLQVLGMKVDPSRGRLLVLTGTDDARIIDFKPTDLGHTGVLIYSLATGRLLRATWLRTHGEHLFNDVSLGRDGAAYITDSDAGRIYRLSSGGRRLTPITGAGVFLYPNGIAIEPALHLLYVADYRGLYTVDLGTGDVQRMPVAKAVSTVAIDGLYLHGNDLIGVQSLQGFDRVMAFHLSKDRRRIESADPLERADPRMSIPTEGVVVGDELYFVADSHQDAPDEKGVIAAPERTAPTTILKLRLPASN